MCGGTAGPEARSDLVADPDRPRSFEVALEDRADTIDLDIDLISRSFSSRSIRNAIMHSSSSRFSG